MTNTMVPYYDDTPITSHITSDTSDIAQHDVDVSEAYILPNVGGFWFRKP